MMANQPDSLSAVITSRIHTTGQSAVDALNSTVPQADPAQRDDLEQRLLARIQSQHVQSERTHPMNYSQAIRGTLNSSSRARVSTSVLLITAFAALCTAVVLFARLLPPPEENESPVAAPVKMDQDQQSGTPTPLMTQTNIVESSLPTSTASSGLAHTVTSTPVPFATSTPIPFSVNLYVPTYVPFAGDHVAPPSVWFAGDAHPSAPGSSGLMVGISFDRLQPTSGEPLITAGTRVNLYTTLALPSQTAPGAAIQRDPLNPSEVVVALVPIASAVDTFTVNSDGSAILRVSVEQGIVLSWLLNDTDAIIYYGSTGE